MYPPGRVIFLRPIKVLDRSERQGEDRGVKTVWDAVWTTPQEIIGEGILVSPKVGTDPLGFHAVSHIHIQLSDWFQHLLSQRLLCV